MAYANTSVGGWTALDTITAGATNTINATKTAGGKVLNSAITVAPSAAKVGKHLIKGGGAAALAFAMVELLDAGIDWVLDPANNAVKYKTVSDTPLDTIPAGAFENYELVWNEDRKMWSWSSQYYASPNVGCNQYVSPSYKYVGFEYKTSTKIACYYAPTSSPANPPAPSENWKTIPIDTVAAKVIANAEAGHAPSQEAVKATALEGFAAGEHDAALDAAATETGTENPPDTENPPKDPDAPAEPFDPAGIISAINALKALLAGILSSITGLSDFFQSEPPAEPTPTDTEVIIDSPLDDFDSDKSYITFTGSCPPNYTASLSIMGNTVPFSFDYAPICTVMSALKPFIVGAGYLSAAYIISGVGRSTSKE